MNNVNEYAVFRSGSRQYRVSVGDSLRIDRIPQEAGESIEFNQVLFLNKNGQATIGAPLVKGAKVKATIVQHGRDKKVIVFKYKPKVRYRRKTGHRQGYTEISVERIVVGRIRKPTTTKLKATETSEA